MSTPALDAHWITADTKTPFYARREFLISEEIESAQVYITGLGQFNLFLNGEKVGDHELDPGWTDYNKCIQYLCFDVKDQLLQGTNVLGAEVGNGWYIWDTDYGYSFHFPPFMPPNPNPYKPFGESLILTLALHVRYVSGKTLELVSDADFQVCAHGVLHSNVYGSELIDGARLQRNFSAPAFLPDASWHSARLLSESERPKGALELATQPPVRAMVRYTAKRLGRVGRHVIYDLGQNISGILQCEVRGQAGEQVDILPAEKLNGQGDVDQMAKNWMPIDNVVSYRLGKSQVWERVRQHFTYFSGRYLAVDSECEVRHLEALSISSAWRRAGSFTCDDARFNQIYDMIEKTVEANMLSVHTDCPTIERFAWQEPNHLMAPSIFFMKDGKALWEKFLKDLRLAQHSAEDTFLDMQGQPIHPGDGLVPAQAPCYIPNVLPVPGMGSFYDIIPWGSTSILGTYWHYLFYGDMQVIRDNYEMGRRYFAYLQTKLTEDGFINHGLGDWGNPESQLARENVETAFLYADAVTMESFARLLAENSEGVTKSNYTFDAASFHDSAERIKRQYNEKLLVYNEQLGFYCYRVWEHKDDAQIFMTQAAEALPLYWGLVPAIRRPDVEKALLHTLQEKQAFVCGEISLPYVIQATRRAGHNALISQFITREQHPSYYAFIRDGETTLGEYWEDNPRSHCHDMMGHIIEWYYNGLAGIQIQAPGCKKLLINPYLPASMNALQCSYRTPYGRLSIRMQRQDGRVSVHIRHPKAIECTVDTSQLGRETKRNVQNI